MASSGWLGEQFIVQRSNNISYYGNVYISSVSRGNTSVTISGTIRFLSKGTSGYSGYYNYGVQADPDGDGGWVTLLGNNESLKNGNYKDVSFNTTINVSSSATSVSMGIKFCAWYNSAHTSTYWDVTKNWTVSFDPGTQAPSGLSAQFVSCTDTAVTLDVDVGNYGTPASASGRYVEGAVLSSSSYSGTYRYKQASNTSSARLIITNSDSGALTITPNTEYHYGVYANNTSASSSAVASDTFVTLPAYITSVNAVHTGGGVVNIAVAHAAEGSALTVYTEYSWDGETWTAVSDTFNVTVSSRRPIYIRRTSDAGETPIYMLSIAPNNGPQIYGSVSNQAKNLSPVYATFGNYFDGRHYVPRSGVGVDILGDQITITKTSSGSGTWTYVFFLIDATDELIGKEVTISGKFSTSGSFGSGPRLFWMRANETWLSLVDGMEYQATGTDKEFSITGTIPARPTDAVKLGLGLYTNWGTSVSQGAYTVYNNVELKANVKNQLRMSTSGTKTDSGSGSTWVLNKDNGTITMTRTVDTYQGGAVNITTGNVGRWASTPVSDSKLTDDDGGFYAIALQSSVAPTTTYSSAGFISTYYIPYTNGSAGSNVSVGGLYTGTGDTYVAGLVNINSGTHIGAVTLYSQYAAISNATIKVQLQKGISDSLVKAENLIDVTKIGSGTSNGLVYSVSPDGLITINGTATAGGHISMDFTLPSSLQDQIFSAYYIGTITGLSNMNLKNGTSVLTGVGALGATKKGGSYIATSSRISQLNKFDIYYVNGAVVNASFRFFVKAGSLVDPITPPVDTKTRKLKKVYGSVDGRAKLIYEE